MATKIETFLQSFLKKDLPDIRAGDTVRIHQKIKEIAKGKASSKEKGGRKLQVFEGVIIARKHGKGVSATITVRKVISGIGVEKIFPIHSPTIEKIEIIKRGKVRRAKLYYLRTAKGKKAKLKKIEFTEAITPEEPKEVAPEEKVPEETKKEKAAETSPEQKSETEKKSENELEEK
ncbi:50S ribosomal protein L19 [Patescibacteria group bacterium]|nr:50S ribosomal protein L19 [Patescibacteria group bacterium]